MNFQKLTIKFEDNHEGQAIVTESSYTMSEDVVFDELFWSWFISCFESLGLQMITNELKKS